MHRLLKSEKQINIEGIYTFFYLEHSRSYHYVGERHNFWEFVYVDSGEITAVADSNCYILSQGDVIFHKPMEFHGMAAVNNKPHNVLVITFEANSPSMNFFADKIFNVNSKQKKILSQILTEFRNVFGTSYNSSESKAFTLSNEQARAYQIGLQHIEYFLLELIRTDNTIRQAENKLAKKNIENAIVTSVKDYLSKNLYTNITIADICEHFNMSKSYISQLFKNETGMGIIDYYIDLKIREAKLLIRQGSLNFTQIAERLGYTSLQHFTRMFKKRTKISPSLYEKSIE